MFEGFELKRVKTENADINLRIGGKGEALILRMDIPKHTRVGIKWHQH